MMRGHPVEILIVEDNEIERTGLGSLLEREGFRTILAASGAEGLAYLRAAGSPPAVVLLDMLMPEVDGWDFLEELEAVDLDRKPHIILTTGSAVIGPAWAQAHGCAGYVRKPIYFNHLLTTIKGCLAA